LSFERVRTRGSLKPGPNLEAWIYNYPVCGSETYSLDFVVTSSVCQVGDVATMYDTVTPDFRARQRRGEFTFSNMSSTRRVSTIDQPGNGFIRMNAAPNPPACTIGGVPHYDGYMWKGAYLPQMVMNFHHVVRPAPLPIPVGIFSDSDIANMQTEVSTGVLAERGQADSNLFESVAEYKETLRLFHGPISSFFRFFKKNREAMKLMGPHEAWLTYRYGIRPLIQDITMVVEGLSKKVGLRRQTSRRNLTKTLTRSTQISETTFWAIVTANQLETDTVTVRGMCIDEYLATLSSNIGFTAKGLITVPWELVRLSFVVDWFVTLGDFLKSYAPAPGYKTLGGSLVTTRQRSYFWTATNTFQNNFETILRPVTGTCSSLYETKSRGGLSGAGVVIKSDFRFASLTRVADSVALIAALVSQYFADSPVGSAIELTRLKVK
jgi:hypothetical protein